jgi:hypothetical protein
MLLPASEQHCYTLQMKADIISKMSVPKSKRKLSQNYIFYRGWVHTAYLVDSGGNFPRSKAAKASN